MGKNDSELQSEQPVADPEEGSPDMFDELTPSELEPPELPEAEPKPPSKFRRFLRLALLWIVGLAGVFALGVGVTWITKVSALQAEIETIRADAAAEMDALRDQHRETLEGLQEELVEADRHIRLVNALVDVASARVAFDEGSIVGVRAALAGTDDRLATLQDELGGDGKKAVEDLRVQLALVLEALSTDSTKIEGILEQLADDLLRLERSLFSE